MAGGCHLDVCESGKADDSHWSLLLAAACRSLCLGSRCGRCWAGADDSRSVEIEYNGEVFQASFVQYAKGSHDLGGQLPKASRNAESSGTLPNQGLCPTLCNAPEWPRLKESLDLNLNELTKSTFGDIFPAKIFLAQSSAPRLGSFLKR